MTTPSTQPTPITGDAPADLSPEAAGARIKRLLFALYDLGLLRLVGREWVSFDQGRFEFASLDEVTLDALLRRLEDIVDVLEGRVSGGSSGGFASIVDDGPLSPGVHRAQIDLIDRLTAVTLPVVATGAAPTAGSVHPPLRR